MIAAELYFSASLQAAQSMFGKSYFALGVAEKLALEESVRANVLGNYAAITPEWLSNIAKPQARPSEQERSVGFQAAPKAPTK